MPTLARLSFWVLPEQMPDLLEAYEERVTPILAKHGLTVSSEQSRTTAEAAFSRLFELPSPAAVAQKRQDLDADPEWREVLRHLADAFGDHAPRTGVQLGSEPYGFELYATASRPGTTVPAGPGRGHWRIHDVPGGFVFAIVRDREGSLWFGTGTEGVCRYDGSTFCFFTCRDGLASNHVRAIHQDRDGCMWFGSGRGPLKGRGVSRYDGHTFSVLTTEDGLAHGTVISILQDRDGIYWFGTEGGGVSRYDGTTFITFSTDDGLAGNVVQAIVQDRDGHLWFGTGDGVSRYDGATWTTLTTEDGLVRNNISTAIEDRQGSLWFGTNGGVSCYDGRTFTNYTTRDGLAGDVVRSIYQDQDGYVWFGTFGGGVSRYDGQSFSTFATRDGLAQLRVVSIGQDGEGHLWFGTHRGVCRYDGRFTTYAVEDGLADNAVNDMLQDSAGRLWFATDRGVSRYDGTTFTTFTSQDGLASDTVLRMLADRAGNLWFATSRGASRYDGSTFATFSAADGLVDRGIIEMFEDREGNLWFATYGDGAFRYDGTTFTPFTTSEGLPHNAVESICQTKEGHLWFGTYGGVGRYDGDTFTTFDTEGDLTASAPHTVFGDRAGNLWVKIAETLRRYDGMAWTTSTTEGAPRGTLTRVTWQDQQGNLWLAESTGVYRFDGQTFQALTHQDGLAGHSVTSVLEDGEGDLWFGTSDGVTRFHPPVPSSPRVFIDAVVADRRHEEKREVTLPSSAGLIAFEFHATSFKTRPEAVVYRYRLRGHEEDWQTIRARRVEYQDLATGAYAFEVQAVDRDLNYSESATALVNIQADPRVEALIEALSARGPGREFVGRSPALRQLQAHLGEVAPTDLTVLISGETGTGKGLAARTIHELSARKAGPFIPVNCGAIPDELVESELFGHEKGAFTGAVARKIGKVELALDGTLFLDEIGDLAPAAQVKLLRVLDDRTFERVGGTEQLQVQVRVIAATNRDLSQMVAAGQFRSDLYFRLRVLPVRVPSLRERQQDIQLLAFYFMERMASHLSKEVTDLTPGASALLQEHPWPGNVRELEHVMQRAVIVCSGSVIRTEDVSLEWRPTEAATVGERLTLEEHERRYIREVLEETGWVVKGEHGATAILGMPESTLRHRMKKLGIRRP